jgi:hypothetical protein
MPGDAVQKLGILVNNPPAGNWVEQPSLGPAFHVQADARGIFGFSANEVYACNGDGVAKWDGATWTNVLTGFTVRRSLWGPAPGHIFCVGGGGAQAILVSTDGGATWNPGTPPAEAGLNVWAIWGVDANTIFLAGGSAVNVSRVWLSTDGGATWNAIFNDPNGETLTQIFGYAVNDVYFGGSFGELVHWDGVAATVLQADTFDGNVTDLWGAAPGRCRFSTDFPNLPEKQLMNAVPPAVYADNGPYPTNDGANPTVYMNGVKGKDANTIWACGTATNAQGRDAGANVYKCSVPSDSGPSTWVQDNTLPASASGLHAAADKIWVDVATGKVFVVGTKDDGAGGTVATSWIRTP